MSELARLSAVELRAAYAVGSLSPVTVAEAVVAVIDEAEPTLNAFWVRSDRDRILAEAEASQARWEAGRPLGPIDGIPLTLKENIGRAGVPMPSGTAAVEHVVPDVDSPVAASVGAAGGIVLGSTVMPDWGMLSSGVSSLHGITRSPWDPTWTTGGSSSGAGAAAAAGYGPLHVGTDIGGSIRLPGTWLGLATLKPSAGRVPLEKPYLGRVAGPMARSVADLALFLQVLAQPDRRDWTALPPPSDDWFTELAALADGGPSSGRLDGVRVGVQVDAGCGSAVDPMVQTVVHRVADAAARAGAAVSPVQPWMSERLLSDLDLFWRARSLADFVDLPPERQDLVLPFIQRWVSGAADASGERMLRCYGSIMEIQKRTVVATEEHDIVISPVAPGVAFPAESPMPWGESDQGMAHIGFTAPYNMSGQPAGTVNAGFTSEGKSIGVQVSGRRWDDVGVLRFMAWWEASEPDFVPRWPIGRHT